MLKMQLSTVVLFGGLCALSVGEPIPGKLSICFIHSITGAYDTSILASPPFYCTQTTTRESFWNDGDLYFLTARYLVYITDAQ